MAQIQFFRGLPAYNVLDLFVLAARFGTFSGGPSLVTLTYLDIVISFEGSGLTHDNNRTLSAGVIDTVRISQGSEDLASATGYDLPVAAFRVQDLLTFLDANPNPDPILLANEVGDLIFQEETLMIGSSEIDQLQGSDFYFTELQGNAGDDVIQGGAGGNFMVGGEGNDQFLGSQGFDQVVYIKETGSGGVVFNWNTGTATDSHGNTDTFTPVSIEAVHGTNSNDILIGDDQGRTFSGYAGDDLIQGGAGYDRVRYDREFKEGGPANGVSVNLQAGIATDSHGDTDTLVSIDNVDGTDFSDNITGSTGENHLHGHGGNDVISGGLGDDFINPGEGNDTVDGGGADFVDGFDNIEYYDAEDAITVNKTSSTSGTVTGAWAGADTFTGIEIVVGSQHDDVFNGSSGNDYFTGMDGVDTFNGSGGSDTVFYEKERTGNGVFVNLTTGTISSNLGSLNAGRALDAFGNLDVLSSIENIVGSRGNDVIVGGNEENDLRGDRGHDLLAGNGGDDTLVGEGGNDTLVGGEGEDTLIGGDDGGVDTADYLLEQNTGSGGGPVTVNFLTGFGTDTYGDTDQYFGLEEATGTTGDDTFTGGSGYNGFRGFGGSDTFINTPDGSGHVWVYYSNDVFAGGGQGVVINLSDQDLVGVGVEAGFAPINLLAHTGKDGFGAIDSYVNIHNLRGTALNDWIMGSDQFDHFQMQAGDDYINGGGGYDLADYARDLDEDAPQRGIIANLSGSALIGVSIGFGTYDVAAGRVIDSFGDTDTLVNIEAVMGTIFQDYLVGGDGEDGFVGFGGNDVIDGGGGDQDRIRYSDDPYLAQNVSVIVNFSDVAQNVGGTVVNAGQVRDNYGDFDTVSNVEAVEGTFLDDAFFGGSTRIEFIGHDGNDVIHGSSANDHLDGGNGDDVFYADDTGPIRWGDYIMPGYGNNTIVATAVFGVGGWRDGHDLSFQDIIEGVTADLNTGFASSVGMTTTFSEVHFLIGGNGNDVLLGGVAAFDRFEGFTGNAGDDHIDGGTGQDEVSYRNEVQSGAADEFGNWVFGTQGVVVDLASHVGIDSYGDTDTLLNIEDVLGTRFGDVIYGDINDNELRGDEGSDELRGGAGNDLLRGDEGGDSGNDHDQLFGEDGDDHFKGGAGNDLIDGGADNDSIDYNSETVFTGDHATHGVIVNLSDVDLVGVSVQGIASTTVEAWRAIDSRGYTDTLISIEDVHGTGFDDIIVGNFSNNELRGDGGSDVLRGGDGGDYLRGDESGDTGNDHDQLFGESGNDWFKGGAGNDLIDGGADRDGIDYNSETDFTGDDATHGVIVNLSSGALVNVAVAGVATTNVAAGTAIDTRNYVDTLVSIEDIAGTDYNDIIVGGDEANEFWAGGGDDFIEGGSGDDTLNGDGGQIVGYGNDALFGGLGNDRLIGGAGVDYMDGGSGFDTLDFESEALSFADGGLHGVVVNLSENALIGVSISGIPETTVLGGQTIDTRGYVDTVASIESVVGTAFEDVLVGSQYDNLLAGNSGDDLIVGNGGSDVIDGGEGIDTVAFSGSRADYRINYLVGEITDLLGSGGTDTISNVEFIRFDDGVFSWGEFAPIGTPRVDFSGNKTADITIMVGGELSYLDGSVPGVRLAGQLAGREFVGVADFDGDGRSDIFLQEAGGWMSYLPAGGSAAPTDIGSAAGRHVVGVGDFDGNGTSDVLLADDLSGWLSLLPGGAGGSPVDVGSIAGRNLIAIADFDGDGADDLLLREDGGWMSLLPHGDGASPVDLGIAAGRTLLAIADFDGNGQFDILLQDASTGWLSYLQGGSVADVVDIGFITGRGLVGIGDFDGDGKSDLLLQEAASKWTSFISGDDFIARDIGEVTQTMLGVDDFDGDGLDDILVHSGSASEALAYLSGGDPSSAVSLTSIDAAAVVGGDMHLWQQNDVLIA